MGEAFFGAGVCCKRYPGCSISLLLRSYASAVVMIIAQWLMQSHASGTVVIDILSEADLIHTREAMLHPIKPLSFPSSVSLRHFFSFSTLPLRLPHHPSHLASPCGACQRPSCRHELWQLPSSIKLLAFSSNMLLRPRIPYRDLFPKEVEIFLTIG